VDALPRRLKRDHLGAIAVVAGADGQPVIERDTGAASFGLRWLARRAAAREARALRALAGIDGVPALLSFDGRRLRRGFVDGAVMNEARPRDPAWFRRAHRLLRAMRARGVLHNDLAKEANWLVRADGAPVVVDFQLAWVARDPRRALFRLLARENLRHLLKHKRTYCPQALTPTERRLLARRSWISRAWHATGKRVYILVARRILHWEDNEGRGRRGLP
jgi:RIO-like serine/threonine protein kinase